MIAAYKFTVRSKNEMDGLWVEINWNTADVRYLELFQTYAIPNKIPRVPRVCLKIYAAYFKPPYFKYFTISNVLSGPLV